MIKPKTFNPAGNFALWLIALFILRMILSVGLYCYAEAKNPQDPILAMSQLTKVSDTLKYHRRAQMLASYWRAEKKTGVWPTAVRPYTFILACIYFVFGPHPLAAAFVNILCAVLLAVLARALALKIGQPPGRAAWLAILAAAWPPTLIWGALPMKDMLTLTLFLSYLYFLSALTSPGSGNSLTRICLNCLGLLLSAYLCVTLRSWLEQATPFLFLLMSGIVLWQLFTAKYLAAVGLFAGAIFLLAGAYLGITSPVHVAVQMGRANLTPFAPGDKHWVEDHQVNLQTIHNFILRHTSLESARIGTDLEVSRKEFRHEGGNMVIRPPKRPAPAAKTESPGIAALGLRAGFNFLFRPHPGDLIRPGMSLAAGLFSLIVMLSWYALLPGVIAGWFIALRREFTASLPILVFCCGAGLAMGYVVINLGTLFRVRESLALPLLLFWNPWPYQWVGRIFSGNKTTP